jgi:hypothetical protein
MAHNEDNDPIDDDDDQHVHHSTPTTPLKLPLLLWINQAHHI